MDDDKDFEELKAAINNFLWTQLPGETALKKAKDISLTVYQLIKYEFDKRPESA